MKKVLAGVLAAIILLGAGWGNGYYMGRNHKPLVSKTDPMVIQKEIEGKMQEIKGMYDSGHYREARQMLRAYQNDLSDSHIAKGTDPCKLASKRSTCASLKALRSSPLRPDGPH